MAVSKNVAEMITRSSWIRKMFESGARLKAEHGEDKVFDFSLGNPNIEPPSAFTKTAAAILAEKSKGKHGYMPNAGYPDVREEVAAYISKEQKVKLTGSNVIMTCGAGGAMNVALKTILNPGDKVLVSSPYFMEYNFYVDNHGGKLEPVNSREDFDLDIDAIESQINAQTAAVIINSPNNPSGRVYPASTLRELGKMLARKSRETRRSVYLLSDEPYRKIVYDGTEVPSVLSFYKNSIIFTSYSKDLSIPGERIGWLAIHPEAEDGQNLIDGFILCNRILGYVNAPALMQRVVARLQGVSVDVTEYKKKRDILCEGLAEIGYEFNKPQGTFYLFPRAPGGNDLEIVELLRKELILTVPGRGFGLPGYFRIAFCVEDRVIEAALPGFERAFRKI
ncbi:MAG: pyridoxal phosphate-dependent aminotransferase [Spirochaetota bacterium]